MSKLSVTANLMVERPDTSAFPVLPFTEAGYQYNSLRVHRLAQCNRDDRFNDVCRPNGMLRPLQRDVYN